MTLDLIDAVRDLPHVCEHINLPFQAGDNDVLRRMARRYRSEDYRALIGTIRERVPDVSLSTDVIVGFPGETEAQFERTLAMLHDIEFDVVHVAMYSPRRGTPAPAGVAGRRVRRPKRSAAAAPSKTPSARSPSAATKRSSAQ